MPESLTIRLEALRPAIKTRWAALLQAEPAAPPTGAAFITPGMLVFLLDATLARLTDWLREPRAMDRLGRDPAPFEELRAGCHCGLHLLLTYYLNGTRALQEVLPDGVGMARVEVLHGFNQLGHDEMTALCGLCHHRGGPLCCLPREPVLRSPDPAVNPPGAAASPATLSATGPSPGGTPG